MNRGISVSEYPPGLAPYLAGYENGTFIDEALGNQWSPPQWMALPRSRVTTHTVLTAHLDGWLGVREWEKRSQGLALDRHDPSTFQRADLRYPLPVVIFPPARLPERYRSYAMGWPVDGAHRAAKALYEGVAELPIHVLTPAEQRLVLKSGPGLNPKGPIWTGTAVDYILSMCLRLPWAEAKLEDRWPSSLGPVPPDPQ